MIPVTDSTADQLAVLALKHQWAFLRDDGDIDALMRLYAPGARTELGVLGDVVGEDAIRVNLERMLAGHRPGTTLHQVTNGLVEIAADGESAQAEWYLRVMRIDVDTGEMRTTSLGRYRDKLRKIDGEWRFAVVKLTTLWRSRP